MPVVISKPCGAAGRSEAGWRAGAGRRTACEGLFVYLALRNAGFLIAVKHGRGRGFRLIRDRLTYSRRIPCRTSKQEIKRGRDITWKLRAMPAPDSVMEQWPGSATIIVVRSHGVREGKPQDENRYYVTSFAPAPRLCSKNRQRWSIADSWHWVRDVPLREDATATA